jgi:23S rRNA (adenine2503-C2)-methyltransferase
VSTPLDPYDLDEQALVDLLSQYGQPAYRVTQVREWLARGVDDAREMTNLPSDLRDALAPRFDATRPELVAHTVADGGHTHKLLLRYPDGEAIETVLMLYRDRATVCISTQAGCAMGCPFCATGQAGFRRQLTTGEVVRQVVVADTVLRSGQLRAASAADDGDWDLPGDHSAADAPRASHADTPEVASRLGITRVTNVVFMGMGEPLANLDVTIASLRYFHEQLGLSARHLTVSTVGLVPGIRRLAELGLPVTLAVSLHAADDTLRDELVPVNRQHPLAEVEEAMRDWRAATNRRVSIEWCLIGDVNDSIQDAARLAAIARRTRSHVNVIPMNPTPGVQWREPSDSAVRAFMDELERRGAQATLRDTRGRDADAACGQLLARYTLGQGRRLPVAVGAADRVDALREGRT